MFNSDLEKSLMMILIYLWLEEESYDENPALSWKRILMMYVQLWYKNSQQQPFDDNYVQLWPEEEYPDLPGPSQPSQLQHTRQGIKAKII
jgi:hypothetical protein